MNIECPSCQKIYKTRWWFNNHSCIQKKKLEERRTERNKLEEQRRIEVKERLKEKEKELWLYKGMPIYFFDFDCSREWNCTVIEVWFWYFYTDLYMPTKEQIDLQFLNRWLFIKVVRDWIENRRYAPLELKLWYDYVCLPSMFVNKDEAYKHCAEKNDLQINYKQCGYCWKHKKPDELESWFCKWKWCYWSYVMSREW